MRAIFHPEYKTARELDDKIAEIEQTLAQLPARIFSTTVACLSNTREELLYDLANRRDDGELRWINPGSYQAHSLLLWRDLIETILFRASPFIEKIPKYEKRLTP
jgi:hypothetical protein